jgi:hypothetical protein
MVFAPTLFSSFSFGLKKKKNSDQYRRMYPEKAGKESKTNQIDW